jgi:hypothetical protein
VRVPAGTRHGYRNTSQERVEMLVWFTPGGFEELFVKYRTDHLPSHGPGFTFEASEAFDTTFES